MAVQRSLGWSSVKKSETMTGKNPEIDSQGEILHSILEERMALRNHWSKKLKKENNFFNPRSNDLVSLHFTYISFIYSSRQSWFLKKIHSS